MCASFWTVRRLLPLLVELGAELGQRLPQARLVLEMPRLNRLGGNAGMRVIKVAPFDRQHAMHDVIAGADMCWSRLFTKRK